MIEAKLKSVIISDIHNRVGWIDDFVNKTEYDELIFLGDYFDSHDDRHPIRAEKNTEKTARWLKQASETYKNTIWLLGNHDIPYIVPWNLDLICPGWTREKHQIVKRWAINWENFRLCYYTQGFLLSHAGVSKEIFSHPVHGLTIQGIENQCKEALTSAKGGMTDAALMCGRDRGGSIHLPGGGITWLDWDTFEPINGLNQIVGHTQGNFVRQKQIPGSENYCLDTCNRDVGIIEDGKFSWISRY